MQNHISLSKSVIVLALISFIWNGCASTTPGGIPVGSIVPTDNIPVLIRQDIYHVVSRLETMWRISKMYGVSIQSILNANGLKNASQIKVGQKLLIPRASSARPVIPVYNVRKWTHLVIHHTATETGNASTIDHIHYKRGFEKGLGYHFLIDNGTLGKVNGQIEVGPRWIKQMNGAHANAAGMNEKGIGIALVGNFSEQRYVPDAQLNSLVFLVNALRKHYRIPVDRIIRHRDVPGKNTECPGNYFPWDEFKRRLAVSG